MTPFKPETPLPRVSTSCPPPLAFTRGLLARPTRETSSGFRSLDNKRANDTFKPETPLPRVSTSCPPPLAFTRGLLARPTRETSSGFRCSSLKESRDRSIFNFMAALKQACKRSFCHQTLAAKRLILCSRVRKWVPECCAQETSALRSWSTLQRHWFQSRYPRPEFQTRESSVWKTVKKTAWYRTIGQSPRQIYSPSGETLETDKKRVFSFLFSFFFGLLGGAEC